MKNDDENQQSNGFFDKNTITAVVLSFLVFFGWQMYMTKKYPKTPAKPVTAEASKETTPGTGTGTTNLGTPEATQKASDLAKSPAVAPAIVPQTLKYSSDKLEIDLVNTGFGIQKIALKEFSDRKDKMIQYDAGEGLDVLLATKIDDQNQFDIRKISDTEFEGTLVGAGMRATKRVVVDPALYLIKTTVQVQYDDAKKLKMESAITGAIEKVEKTFFLPAYEHQELFVLTPEKTNREYLNLGQGLAPVTYEGGQVVAFNSQYFALAAINRADILPSVETVSDGKTGKLNIIYKTEEPKKDYTIAYDFYFGPKKTEILATIDESLKEIVNYGMFAFIGRPLLAIMKVIFSFFQNWGIAIIILTILVKLVLFPLHMYSIKSMKKMQKIQPRLKEIKEKYKNDPQRANQETLQLMKAEKANPLSGCLPMLMQIPIFLALYSMLGQSFELYKQPFYFWIHDLSVKDPFFVMPILAGAVFFVQQKLTPTTGMDPAQAKVMMFMPVLMTAFMVTVPSGLALYMFVNAVFSVFQQLLITRDKTT